MPSGSDTSDLAARPLGQVAYERLRTMILAGEVRPGERLGERELARRIQVSRTPLREALGRLERDGLAVNKPGLGYFAVEFDPRTVSDIYEFRELLELHVCRGAAERIGDAGTRALRQIMAMLARFEEQESLSVDQVREEVELGFRIHEIIAEEAGNAMICETLMQLYDRLRLLEWIDVLWIDKWPTTRREHRDLVAAMLDRDGERAVAVARAHLRRCREDALRVIKAQYREGRHGIQSRPFIRQR
ncbi:MAG TPA: GntR family transcriptional regulator [Stellaceae bacterium]|nr:GntR family transcriptional regulator [Stellaceae bacterium]